METPAKSPGLAWNICFFANSSSGKNSTLLGRIPGYFYIHWLSFSCIREDLFKALRETWEIEQDDYRRTFGRSEKNDALQFMGDMGRYQRRNPQVKLGVNLLYDRPD
jgi:hypothetical protein